MLFIVPNKDTVLPIMDTHTQSINIVNAQDSSDLSLKDYLRFYAFVWPLPDSNYGEEDKYFLQKYTRLTKPMVDLFNSLLSIGTSHIWDYDMLIMALNKNLLPHTQLLKNNKELANLASSHTGSALSIKTSKGSKFSSYLRNIELVSDFTVYRTLSEDYYPLLHSGNIDKTRDIWSTSYDPISSIGFGIADPDITNTYVLRIRLPSGFHGGLLVENNCRPDVVKEQHELTIVSDKRFRVDAIINNVKLHIFDDKLNIRVIHAKVYDIQMFEI